MIDYDLDDEFSDFIKDAGNFFKQFNDSVPANLEVDHEDRAGLYIAFFLSKISDSLQSIENLITKKIENG